MLAYFMTSPGSNHAITPLQPEQPAQQHSQQQVLVRAQQLAAAASSSQQLLPASAAATAQSTKKRHRKQAATLPVLSGSRRTWGAISGSELRSPAPCN